jgi:hypothetical protein
MIGSLGFVLLKIKNDNHYDIILKNIKALIDKNFYSNICIFNSSCEKIETYNIPIFHLSHSKFFNGKLFLFDLQSIILTKTFTNLEKKIIYTDNIPWTKNRTGPYKEWQDIYEKELDFITTNEYLYDIYNLCWKKPIGIMENFNHEKIQDILQSAI